MSDDRTPNQYDADLVLENAIMKNLTEYGIIPVQGRILLDRWLVIGKVTTFVDGEEEGIYFRLLPDGGVSVDYDTLVGMLRRAEKQLLHKFKSEGQQE